jgi:hypothetical protein
MKFPAGTQAPYRNLRSLQGPTVSSLQEPKLLLGTYAHYMNLSSLQEPTLLTVT